MSHKSTYQAKTKKESRFVDTNFAEFQSANYNPIDGYEELVVSSLEQAVQPIHLLIPGISDYVTHAKQKCVQNSPLLTLEECAAIYLYTMSTNLFKQLNKALRAKKRWELKPWFPFLKLFITALKKLPPLNGTVWRGIIGNVTSGFSENDNETWWSVNSCSTDIKVAQAFLSPSGTLFAIHTTSGRSIHEYSAHKDEKEVVLLPGTRLLIQSGVMNHSDSLFIVSMQEENSGTSFVAPSDPNSNSHTPSTEITEKGYPDGSRYEGYLKNGKRHCFGVHYYKDGGDYTGQWVDDEQNGEGIRTFSSGSRYEAMYRNSKKHGYGIYWFANGQIYDGEWIDDKGNGQAIYIWPDKTQYRGMFKDNLKHGYGILAFPDGRTWKGFWENDKYKGEIQ
ncbi:unnamed protein product [Rotaria socialis]|uniref:NAD(P)(+)--arginine ADP-ribosyltransferase n=1 Tax=Rotaria socialis TaxID=392032 RepID=A0A817VIZ1_9BILA|nr:unnamed protein product [Rotaria socialis]